MEMEFIWYIECRWFFLELFALGDRFIDFQELTVLHFLNIPLEPSVGTLALPKTMLDYTFRVNH